METLFTVTLMEMVPAGRAGATTVNCVLLVTVTTVPGVAPKRTVTVAPPAGANPDPVIVTVFPPAVGPFTGLTLVTSTPAVYVKSSLVASAGSGATTLPDCTETSTLPAPCGGAVACSDVSVTFVTVVAVAVPNFTVGVPRNPLPVTVTTVPGGPATGETLASVTPT